MTNFCIPQGVQDIENAQRTAQVYTYAGSWDPRLNPTDAKPGTLFIYFGDPDSGIAPTLLQKQDTGCTINWNAISGGGGGQGTLGGWPVIGPVDYDSADPASIQARIEAAKTAAVTTAVTGGGAALRNAINNANDGDVLEVQDSLNYINIDFPAGKSLVIRAQIGQTPVIGSVTEGVTIFDGASGYIVIGLTFDNCASADSNSRGSCVALDHEAVFSDIIFADCVFSNGQSSPAIGLAYHQTTGGDTYTATYLAAELSDGFAVVNCLFDAAAPAHVEGGDILIRGVENVLLRNNTHDKYYSNGRAVNIMQCPDAVIEDCRCLNGDSNYECFKVDSLGTQTIMTTGTTRRCLADGGSEGFDSDDDSEMNFEGCIARNCGEGFSIAKANSKSNFIGCLAYCNADGFKVGAAVLVPNVNIIDCMSIGNTAEDFDIDNGYVVPAESRYNGARFSLELPAPNLNRITLYVDKYANCAMPDGSFERPFPAIMDAVNEIAKRGDNSTRPYVVRVGAGVYDENVVLEDTSFYELAFIGDHRSVVQPGAGLALQSIADNDNLAKLFFTDIDFIGDVTLIGASDGTNFCSSEGRFRNALMNGKLTAHNLTDMELVGCQMNDDLDIENCPKFIMSGGEGQGPFQTDVVWNAGNNKPSGATFSYLIVERCVMLASTVNVSAGATLQIREGVRYSNPGGTSTIDGAFIAYASWIWAGAFAGTGTLEFNGSFYSTGVTNLAGFGGAITNNNDPGAMNYVAANPANWVAPVPTDLHTAVQRLEQQVQVLTAGPIP